MSGSRTDVELMVGLAIESRFGGTVPGGLLGRLVAHVCARGSKLEAGDLLAMASIREAEGDRGLVAWTRHNQERLLDDVPAVARRLCMDELRFALETAMRLTDAGDARRARWAIRWRLLRRFPGDRLRAAPTAGGGRTWTIERDRRTGGVRVLLVDREGPLLATTFGDHWVWAVEGISTFQDDVGLHVSDEPPTGTLLSLDHDIWLWADTGPDVVSVVEAARRVACGQARACFALGASALDRGIAALIVREADGQASELAPGGLVMSNGVDHAAVEHEARELLAAMKPLRGEETPWTGTA